MLRKTSLLFLFVFFSLVACDTKSDVEGEFKNYFIKYFGEDGDQEAVDFFADADGSIVILGSTEQIAGQKSILLFKLDKNGSVLWQTKMGGGDGVITELPQDIELAPDGGYYVLSNMLLGEDPITNENIYDFKILHVSASGTKQDSLIFGNNSGQWKTQFARSITVLSNDGIAIVGNSTDESISEEPNLSGVDTEDVFAIALNFDGSVIWQINDTNQGTPGEHYGSAVKLFEQSTSRFDLFGYSDYTQSSVISSDFNVFKVTDNGSIIAGDKAGLEVISSNEVLNAVCRDPFLNGYFELGTSKADVSDVSGSLYFCRRSSSLVKVMEGSLLNIGGSLSGVDVTPSIAGDGFLVLANEVRSSGSIVRLARTNLSGEVSWSLNVGSMSKRNDARKVIELEDGRILVLATIELATQKKIGLFKMNRNGEFLN